MSEYPVVLHHPAYAAAELGRSEYEGKPARFSPIEVHTPDQEDEVRAKGYLRSGEAPARAPAHIEYPKMLCHPEHKDAVPEETRAVKDEAGFRTYKVAGSPEVYPHVTVKSAEEEEQWAEKGYKALGKFDYAAYDRAVNAPQIEGYNPQEWPKWINGSLIDDPNRPPPANNEYPKWVGAVIVNSREEELRLLNPMPPEPEVQPAPEMLECMSAWEAAAEQSDNNNPADVGALLDRAKRAGLAVDGRWGVARLRSEVERAEMAETV